MMAGLFQCATSAVRPYFLLTTTMQTSRSLDMSASQSYSADSITSAPMAGLAAADRARAGLL